MNKFEGADFKYNNSFLIFSRKSTQISHFWSPTEAFPSFHEILQIDKFEGADFKYDTIVIKFWSNGPKFKDFYFAPNFAIRQIRVLMRN